MVSPQTPPVPQTAALALLRLYAEWGVDEALATVPVDRLAAAPAVARSPARPAPAAPAAAARQPAVAAPSRGQAARAGSLVESAEDLDALQAALDGFDEFGLRQAATHTVRVALGARPRLVVVGEAANGDEDRSGQPFAGSLGIAFDRMLAAIGLTRDDCALLPAIPWRPPGGRAPTTSEIAVCTPLLRRRLMLIDRRLRADGNTGTLLLLGKLPLRMLGGDAAAERSRNGASRQIAVNLDAGPCRAPTPALTLAHPLMVAAQPNLRRNTWHGLLALRALVGAD